jgi:hypothetical protein
VTALSLPKDSAHRDLVRTGQQLPPNWRTLFLEHYAEQGVRWRAAKLAGVSHQTVLNHEGYDPAFAQQVEDARQEFADSRELNLRKLGDNGNVVGDIVLLKKHRPNDFIERRLEMSVSMSTTLDPAETRSLLAALLHTASPSTQRAILEPAGSEGAPAAPPALGATLHAENGVLGDASRDVATRPHEA